MHRQFMQSATRVMVTLWTIGAIATPTTESVQAQVEWTSSRPDGHAPIGVMGDHTHERGEFMLSYRFMRMTMEGNRIGTKRVDVAKVQETFHMAPVDMAMGMHMAGLMYAPGEIVTLLAMGNWIDNSMRVRAAQGAQVTPASSGAGDVTVGALVGLKQSGSTRMHLNAGLSLPVGSIEQVGPTPMSMGRDVQLPYPMQLGSGTWDLKPGITFLGMRERTSWGLQALGTIRLGKNSRNYRKGHAMDATSWFAYRPTAGVSVSTRVLWSTWGNYDGQDNAYGNPMMIPTIREDLRGGQRIDLPVGVNYYFADGALRGHRIAAEWHVPLYQDLNGPQLETDWILTVGWQKSFDP